MYIDTHAHREWQSFNKILKRIKKDNKRELLKSLRSCERWYKHTLDKWTREFWYTMIYNKLKRLWAI